MLKFVMLMWRRRTKQAKPKKEGGDSLEVTYKALIWSLILDNRTWNAINNMNSMKRSFAPKRSRNFGKEKESMNSIKNTTKFSFSSTILLKGTWTSQLMNSAIGMQNSLESILSAFKSIIRSKIFDEFGKLSFNHFCKIIIYLQ